MWMNISTTQLGDSKKPPLVWGHWNKQRRFQGDDGSSSFDDVPLTAPGRSQKAD